MGTWTATTTCLKLSGNVDPSAAGLDPSSCKNPTISGSLTVTGSWTANANGTYTDNTTTTGEAQVELPAGCLMLSGTTTTCEGIAGPLKEVGFSTVTCQPAASGGGCTCTGMINNKGSLAWMTGDPQTSGNYTSASNTITADGTAKYGYCVAGNKLTLSPQSAGITITGTVELQKGDSSGAGGTGGSAGGSGGSTGAGGAAGGSIGTGGMVALGDGPCDIYAASSPATPCVAAFSMVRVLKKSYTGPLYQVRKGGTMTTDGTGANMKTGVRGGGTTQDIKAVGSLADAAAQDAFCGSDTCTVSILYDQSGNHNDLKVAPMGCYKDGSAEFPDFESSATKRSLMVSGHKVYALYTNTREGYRNNATMAMPMKADPQGIYMIMDGKHFGGACCWDFGNAGKDNCNGTVMNTLFFGTGYWGKGAGTGPWFLGDFEGGVWAGGSGASGAMNPMNPSMTMDYAFGILKTNAPNAYAIRTANAQSGGLTTAYDGPGPRNWSNGGGIILGIGGDNSNHSAGTFFEGAITAGRPTDATDALVLQNVQTMGYGK